MNSLLAAAKFNPRQGGPQQIIYDVGNTEYYEIQAIILIQQAVGVRKSKRNTFDYESKMIEAIRLLTLAMLAVKG